MKTLKYRIELLNLFKLLHSKTFSKRGFSSAGKLLSSTLLTLTHTYPLENKFVNIGEWESEGVSGIILLCRSTHRLAEFQLNHHKYWGRLYAPEDVEVSLLSLKVWRLMFSCHLFQLSWHVPDREEIDFAIEIFREVVEPTIALVEALLDPGARTMLILTGA